MDVVDFSISIDADTIDASCMVTRPNPDWRYICGCGWEHSWLIRDDGSHSIPSCQAVRITMPTEDGDTWDREEFRCYGCDAVIEPKFTCREEKHLISGPRSWSGTATLRLINDEDILPQILAPGGFDVGLFRLSQGGHRLTGRVMLKEYGIDAVTNTLTVRFVGAGMPILIKEKDRCKKPVWKWTAKGNRVRI